MFSRSRRTIILSIMGSLFLLFVATLSVIMFASYQEIRQNNMEMLERYVELYYLEDPPDGTDGQMPGMPPDGTDGQMPGMPPAGQGAPMPGARPDGQMNPMSETAPAGQTDNMPETATDGQTAQMGAAAGTGVDGQAAQLPGNGQTDAAQAIDASAEPAPGGQGMQMPGMAPGGPMPGTRPGGENGPMPDAGPGRQNASQPEPATPGEAGKLPEGVPPGQEDGMPKSKPPGQEDPGPGPLPGKPPLDEQTDYKLSTFYAVALAEDDTVLKVDDGEKTVYSEEDLIAIARDILAGGNLSGRTDSLTYMVSKRPGYTLVAFMDNTVTEGSMHTLLRNVLIVGSIAMVVLFFISLYLSGKIIRPLEENDQRQKQFVSDASHELKTPVAVIGMNAEMLTREIGENEWLQNIQYENERMGGLVRQLLDLSRAENAELIMESVDFSRIVTGELLAIETFAFEHGKMISGDVQEEIHVLGNQTQLTQIVSVLLDNAIRYATGPEIEVTLAQQGHHAMLSVVNEGEEIPADKQAHLFERFYRVDEARSGDEPHYGLGLSIAKAAAERHGGSIGVSCREGRIRFEVTIPTKKA